jgi:predicted LPLAT superfamily acyltransferase
MNPQWLAQAERSNIFALRILVWITTVLGRRVGQWLLYPICFYFILFSVKARRASKQYLARALGRPAGWRDVFQHYRTFATVALDRVFLLNDRFDLFDIQSYGHEPLLDLVDHKRGALLLGAHIGSFEILRAIAEKGRGVTVRMLMFEDIARKLNAVLHAINPNFKMNIIGLGKLDSMLKIGEHLDAGELVGMLGDRAISATGQVKIKFFGQDAEFPDAPFRLAAMLKCPVILMVGLYRGGNRYDLYFEQLVDGLPVGRNERARVIQSWQRLYVERLEYYCRMAPYNWFNFYDFWNADDKIDC